MISITNEDNMQLMDRYKDKYFDLAIVDPPYRDENQPTKEMRKLGSMNSLNGRHFKKYWDNLFRISKNQIVWGANNFELKQWQGFLVWDKKITGVKGKYSDCELASISQGLGSTSSIFRYSVQNVPELKIHPTQKPVSLYEWILMNYAKEGDKILDTHLGSGSIALACHNLGYDLTACELDKEYYDAAIKRIEQHKQQIRLF